MDTVHISIMLIKKVDIWLHRGEDIGSHDLLSAGCPQQTHDAICGASHYSRARIGKRSESNALTSQCLAIVLHGRVTSLLPTKIDGPEAEEAILTGGH